MFNSAPGCFVRTSSPRRPKLQSQNPQSAQFALLRPSVDLVRYGVSRLSLHQDKSWEQGLKETVEWYRANSSRFGEIEHCLVAHPRAGLGKEVDSSV